MTFFGSSMMEKNYGRSEGEENIGVFPATMGGLGRAMHYSLLGPSIRRRVCVQGVGSN